MLLEEIHVSHSLAISFLEEGNQRRAAEVLEEVISQLCRYKLPSHNYADSENGQSCVSIRAEEIFPMDRPTLSEGDFFVYPFIFECITPASQKEDDNDSPTAEQVCFCTVTCLFNLGLCYHLEWSVHKRAASDRLLYRALCFYEQAFSFATTYRLDPANPTHEILLAICANSIHCYGQLADIHQLQFWNSRLLQCLKFSAAIHEFSNHHTFFHLHAFFHSFGFVASAAA